jgi:hypothetical protein
MKQTEGEGIDEQSKFYAFLEGMGLTDKPGAGAAIYSQIKKTGGLPQNFMKGLKDALKTPEERAAKNMKTFDGSVIKFGKRVDDLQNTISDFITGGVVKMTSAVDEFSNATGLFKSDVEKLALLLAGGAGLMGLGRGVGMGIPGPMGGGGVAGKGGMRGIGFLGAAGNIVGAAAAGLLIGSAIRQELDIWTQGEFSKTIQTGWERAIQGVGELFGQDPFGDKMMRESDKYKPFIKEFSKAARDQGMGMEGDVHGFYKGMFESREDIIEKRGEIVKEIERGNLGLVPGGLTEKDLPALKKEPTPEEVARYYNIERSKPKIWDLPRAGERVEGAKLQTDIITGKMPRMELPEEEEDQDFSAIPHPDLTDGGEVPLEMYQGGVVPDTQYLEGGGYAKYGTTKGSKDRGAAIASFFKKKKPKPKPKKKKKESHSGAAGYFTAALKRMKGKARGGPIGTDTTLAWLTPGEYVVNANDTAKNLPALVYANAGGLIGPADAPSVQQSEVVMPDMNFSGMENAMNANTSAMRQLTNILLSTNLGQPVMRDHPRGSYGVKYG